MRAAHLAMTRSERKSPMAAQMASRVRDEGSANTPEAEADDPRRRLVVVVVRSGSEEEAGGGGEYLRRTAAAARERSDERLEGILHPLTSEKRAAMSDESTAA